MNPPRILLSNVASLVVFLFVMSSVARAQETIESTNRAGIKLSYIPAAKLNEAELRQVLWEARQVGITNVESVRTVYGIPGLSRHVIVKSKERVDGRNIFYETLSMGRKSWESDGRKGSFLQTGDFQAEASGKQTHLERTYQLGGSTRRIALKEKDILVADKAIPLIAAKKVRFKNDVAGVGFDRISLMQPAGLRKDSSTDDYELWLHTSQDIIRFRYENEEVVITGIGQYDI
jgi:hypothetical protein